MGRFTLTLYIFLTVCLFDSAQTCDVNGLKNCKSIAQSAISASSTASACRDYNKYKACTRSLYSSCSVNDKAIVEAVYLEEVTKLGCEADPKDLQCPVGFSTQISTCLQTNPYTGSSYEDDSQYCPWFKKVLECAVGIVGSNCGANAAAAYTVTYSYQKLTSGSIHYCPQVWNPFTGKISPSSGEGGGSSGGDNNHANTPLMSLLSLILVFYVLKKAV